MQILVPSPAGDNRPRAFMPWALRLGSAVVAALRQDLDAIEVADVLDIAATLAAAQVNEEPDRS